MATDIEMLKALTADDRLDEGEKDTFDDMHDVVKSGKRLSQKQRTYVQSRFHQLELDAGEVLNLMSSGKVTRGKEVRMGFEDMKRPLKPPGRA